MLGPLIAVPDTIWAALLPPFDSTCGLQEMFDFETKKGEDWSLERDEPALCAGAAVAWGFSGLGHLLVTWRRKKADSGVTGGEGAD